MGNIIKNHKSSQITHGTFNAAALYNSLPPPLQPRRLSFGGFGTLRKKRSDDGDEYVCPMNVATPTSFQRTQVQSYKEEEELEQVRSSARPHQQWVKVEVEVEV